MTTNAINTENLKQKLSSILHSGGGEKSTKIAPLSLINENPYETTLQHNLVVTTNLQLPSLTEENAVYMCTIGFFEYFLAKDTDGISLQRYNETSKNKCYFFPKGGLIDGVITFYEMDNDDITYRYDYKVKSFIDDVPDLSNIKIHEGHAKFTMGGSMSGRIEYYFEVGFNPASGINFPVIVPIMIFPKEIPIFHSNNSGFLVNMLVSYETPDEDTINFYQKADEYNSIYPIVEDFYNIKGPLVSSTGESYFYSIEEPLKGVENPDNEIKAEFRKQTSELIININYPAGTDVSTGITIYGVNLAVSSSLGAYSKLIYQVRTTNSGMFIILSIDISNEPEFLNVLNGTNITLIYDYIMYWDGDPGPDPDPDPDDPDAPVDLA